MSELRKKVRFNMLNSGYTSLVNERADVKRTFPVVCKAGFMSLQRKNESVPSAVSLCTSAVIQYCARI